MKDKIKNIKKEFEVYLKDSLVYLDNVPEPLATAVTYALEGGKRLRPILALFGAEFMQKDIKQVFEIALGLECIHNYSLCHDDLPCMDDDLLRHGKASCHAVFGEGMALLAGDGLLNLAFEFMLAKQNASIEHYKAVAYISRMSGVHGMVGGQCIDMVTEELRDKSLAEVIKLNMLKTACLFKGALVGSIISLGASDEEVSALETYAEKIGLIFQIIDDILDITSTSDVMGKSVNKDNANNKITYISIVGMQDALLDIEKLEAEAIAAVEKFGTRAGNLINFAKYLSRRIN